MAKRNRKKAPVRKRPSSLGKRIDNLELTLRMMNDARLTTSKPPNERPLLAQMLHEAEMRAETAERARQELSRKLTGLLSSDQLEAAKIAGCAPEIYAIEWIELQKERLFPNHTALLKPFGVLRFGNPNQETIPR